MSRFLLLSSSLALAFLTLAPAAAPAADEVKPVAKAAVVAPGTTAPRPALTAEEKALFAVEEEGRLQVDALVKSMAGLPDGPVLRALERKVEEVKQDGRIQFLQVKVQFARQRGDLATAQQAEQMIDLILNPPKPASAPGARPETDRARKEAGRP